MAVRKINAGFITSRLVLLLFFLLTFFPFYLLIIGSFKHQLQLIRNPWFFTLPLHFDNYVRAFNFIALSMLNSIVITIFIMAIVIFASSTGAYAFARFKFPGFDLLYFGIIMLLMVPVFAMLIPKFILVKDLGLLNTYAGQILPLSAQFAAMGLLLTRSFFEGIPDSLFESAQIEGAKEHHIFLRIVVPLSKPIIATVAIMSGYRGWNNYIWPLVVTSGPEVRPIIVTLPLLVGGVEAGKGPMLAGYVIGAVPLIILFIFATKPFISGITAGAVKG